jgi:hypothetical protein
MLALDLPIHSCLQRLALRSHRGKWYRKIPLLLSEHVVMLSFLRFRVLKKALKTSQSFSKALP